MPADIEGREWHIGEFFTDKVLTTNVLTMASPFRQIGWGRVPYIAFEDGTIKGSPGCGRFTGTYRRSDDQLTISAEWTDDKGTPCDEEEKEDAAQIIRDFNNVRKIHIDPKYVHLGALLLADGKGATQITLSLMQAGKDLSELHDTFWHLKQLQGTNNGFSGVILNIEKGSITFSTRSCSLSIPTGYELTGMEFFPSFALGCGDKTNVSQDKQFANVFEHVLHKFGSYELNKDSLTFVDKDRHPIMVFGSILESGIENRRWRIAKYRGGSTDLKDEEGLIEAKNSANITFLNGRVKGSSGCGLWVGSYMLSGDELTFQASAILAGYCDPEHLAQGFGVENAFKGDRRKEQKDDNILLRDKSGKAQILLVPF